MHSLLRGPPGVPRVLGLWAAGGKLKARGWSSCWCGRIRPQPMMLLTLCPLRAHPPPTSHTGSTGVAGEVLAPPHAVTWSERAHVTPSPHGPPAGVARTGTLLLAGCSGAALALTGTGHAAPLSRDALLGLASLFVPPGPPSKSVMKPGDSAGLVDRVQQARVVPPSGRPIPGTQVGREGGSPKGIVRPGRHLQYGLSVPYLTSRPGSVLTPRPGRKPRQGCGRQAARRLALRSDLHTKQMKTWPACPHSVGHVKSPHAPLPSSSAHWRGQRGRQRQERSRLRSPEDGRGHLRGWGYPGGLAQAWLACGWGTCVVLLGLRSLLVARGLLGSVASCKKEEIASHTANVSDTRQLTWLQARPRQAALKRWVGVEGRASWVTWIGRRAAWGSRTGPRPL